MAERVRFELTVLAYTRFPGVHLKPLGHLSITVYIKKICASIYTVPEILAIKKINRF